MAQLDFDFHARPARPGKLGLALALAGIVALASVWMNLHSAQTRAAELDAQIASIERTRPRAATQPAVPRDAPTQTAQKNIAAQLQYTWQPAFDALNAARSSKIALLSLEAVQAKAQLKLVAEARQLADVIAFIEVLQQQSGVRHAELMQHELQEDGAEKPVRCIILVALNP